jgi:hypothetical protein
MDITKLQNAERRALNELQRAAIERAFAEITQDEWDGYAIRYASAVRERREAQMSNLDTAAVQFSAQLYGA